MPTFTHGKSTKFYLNTAGTALSSTATATMLAVAFTYDISAYSKEVTFPRKMDTAETSTFGSSQKTYVQGLSDATISISGSWDATAGMLDTSGANSTNLDAILSNMIAATTAPSFNYAPTGNAAAGKIAYHGTVVMTSYQVSGSIGDLVGFSAEFQIASGPLRISYAS
jgi:hypothetical protein